MNKIIKKVGIIGAGVSGLVTAKNLLQAGFDCEIFERKSLLGGVWVSGYHLLKLQLPKQSYEFFDLPMPSSYDEFPTCDQTLAYLNAYSHFFDIFDKINFNCNVTALKRDQENKEWIVKYATQKSLIEKQKAFDFIILCQGLYSTPNIPEYPGQEKFKGHIFHSSTFNAPKLAEGHKVVVVGFGKSALDTTENAASLTNDVTLLFRRAHWPLPIKLFDVLPIKFMNRFLSSMLPPYVHPTKTNQWIHKYCKLFIWLFWRTLEFLLRIQFQLKSSGINPEYKIEQDIFTCDFIAPKHLFSLLDQGKVKAIESEIKQFTPNGLELKNGAHIEADRIVFATGWQQGISFLPEEYTDIAEKDGIYLYRHIVHPKIPDLAFIGSASTFNNSLTDELQSLWTVELIKGNIILPSKESMLNEIEAIKKWKRSFMPPQRARGSILQLHGLAYHDELLTDMRLEPPKQKNVIKEFFKNYQPSDYVHTINSLSYKLTTTFPPEASDLIKINLSKRSLKAVDLSGLNLSELNLSHKDLQSSDLRRTHLFRTNLSNANLQSCNLSGSDLRNAELYNTNCSNAVLKSANFEKAFLIEANFKHANLNRANFTDANLSKASLSNANLIGTQLQRADLSDANLTSANLIGANLTQCNLNNAVLKGADLREANLNGAILTSADFTNAKISGIKYNETETCKDIRINQANGNSLFKRFAQDQSYIEEYKDKRPILYSLWKISSDCGRSLSLWILWCFIFIIGFSLIFHFHLGGGESFFIQELSKDPNFDPNSWAPMLYCSIVTFTTLGFGDIVPITQEAAWWIAVEVMTGYLMLGGLLSILAYKIARRS